MEVMDSVPRVGLVPNQPPDALQLVASVLDHVSVVVPPLMRVVGFAVIVTVGVGAMETLAVAAPMPPAPMQNSV